MKKTTPEQRQTYKLKRRFRKWREMIATSHKVYRRSQRSIAIVEKTIAAGESSGFWSHIQNSIREAN